METISFLEKTAEYLINTYKEDISDICIVFPSRRGGTFFKRHLAIKISSGIWSPEIFSSEDFISRISGVEILDNVSLLFNLYSVYLKIQKINPDSFEEFSKWGNILIHDFNEVDRYLADAESLYKNLSEVKEIENWSLGKADLTEFQQNYLKFWDSLGTLYHDFKKELLSKRKAHQGLAYRIAAENIDTLIISHPWKKIIFVGFNALNSSEEKIFASLEKSGKAEIIWDSDQYYLNNTNHEAGKFLRKYRSTFGKENFKWVENHLSAEKKNVTVIGVPKNILQARVAGDIISKIAPGERNLDETAIVLADEGLLFPVLSSLPEIIQDVNITMGYSLKNAPVADLFDLLLEMHENKEKFGKGQNVFYYKDLVKIFSHITLNTLFDENKNVSRILVKEILKRNLIFVDINALKAIAGEQYNEGFKILVPLLQKWNSFDDALESFVYLLERLKSIIIKTAAKKEGRVKKGADLDMEFLVTFSKVLNRISDMAVHYPEIKDVKTFRLIFKQFVEMATIPFYGEPLKGLQLMGMLETRTLDFETVILLSANENILPSGKNNNSFIPFDIKKIFGLPNYSDKDAIFAYHFYRLLQRAKNIYLVYNTEPDLLGNGEKSRFITQLLHELPKANKNVVIKEEILDLKISNHLYEHKINIEKTPEVLKKIRKKGEEGYSPSLLNLFRNCGLQFYFHLVAGLREANEVEELIGADTMGTVAHSVLYKLYHPFISRQLTVNDVLEMKKLVETYTNEAFLEHINQEDLKYGKNYLTVRVTIKFIRDLLDKEIQLVELSLKKSEPLIIHALEQNLDTKVTINNNPDPVKVKGTIDRIDSLGKVKRIIDYKTGKVNDKEIQVRDWDQLQNDSEISKSFQLLLYAYIYNRNSKLKDQIIQAGIITFRQLSAGVKPIKIRNEKDLSIDVLNQFEQQLQKLLDEIYDPEKVFTQTSAIENCEYCGFKKVCHR